MHVLESTNIFWVGGREDYITEYNNYLLQQGYEFSLITSDLRADPASLKIFSNILVTENEGYVEKWNDWLVRAEDLLGRKTIQLVWAHHFDLLPAWIFSRLHNIPLLVTFHGPLINAGRANTPMQALGMTLCICREGGVSAVSREIIDNLAWLYPETHQRILLPNTNSDEDYTGTAVSGTPKKFIMISRREKLGHLRAAMQLFHTYQQQVPGSRLTFVTGSRSDDVSFPEQKFGLSREKLGELVKLLGARWCFEQGIGFVQTLLKTNFIGYRDNPQNLIQAADVVMGMGRVVMNGLIWRRMVVLVGYERAHCLVTDRNFTKLQWSNFSGRGVAYQTNNTICDDILCSAKESIKLSDKNLSSLLTEENGSMLVSFVKTLDEVHAYPNEEKQLAHKMKSYLSQQIPEEEIFSLTCSTLLRKEMKIFYQLCNG